MKHLYRERGYTLFLTVLTIFVFGIIIISLLTITISGAKRSELREDVTRASELAEKAFKQLSQQINYDLQTELNKHEDGLPKSIFLQEIENVVKTYKCNENDTFVNAETGEYYACVVEHIDKGIDVLPQRVKLRTTGKVNDKVKNYESIIELNGNILPDDMDYVVNTFISEKCVESDGKDCVPGEGNLFLHGGSSIQGDVNVDRNLITSNRSHEEYAGHHWIHSYFPSAENKPNGDTPKIIVGNDIYTLSWDANKYSGTKIKGFDYAKHIALIDNIPENEPYEKRDMFDENVFVGSYIPIMSNRVDHPGFRELNITAEKDKYQYGPNSSGVKQIETNLFGTGGVDRVIYNEQYPNDKVFPKWYRNFEGKFHIRGNSTFKQFSTYGDVILGGVRLNNNIEFIDGAYIDGNLEIKNNTEVKGPIYVNGDLIIKGKNITINNVMYVNGMVHIKHAEYDEGILAEIKGDHIIYANKKIVIERINRFNDHPTTLHAYYYSNESIEVDGNESNVIINGGVSAPRIVLNSIRGRSYSGVRAYQYKPQLVEFRSYDGYEDQKDRKSRLKVTFCPDIFNKYSHLMLESRVSKVLPPKIIELEEV